MDLNGEMEVDSSFVQANAFEQNSSVESSPCSSLLADALVSNSNLDSLSSDDLAWVDSCLVKEPDISNDDYDWSSMKDALIEILGLQPEKPNSSAPRSDDSPCSRPVDTPLREAGNLPVSVVTDFSDFDPIFAKPTTNHGGVITEETSIPLVDEDLQETSLVDAFQPGYKDDEARVSLPVDFGFDFGISTSVAESSTEDIFKVWDLGIPAEEEEEDELVKQLNKVLSERSALDKPTVYDDLKEKPLNDLIAGVAELTL